MIRWTLAMMLVGCGAADVDEDGFTVDEDCNDEDATIHPDAEERFFDDVDSDCDGEVGVAPYIGSWAASTATFNIEAGTGDVDLLVGLPLDGGIDIGADGSVIIDFTATDPGGTTEVDFDGSAENASADQFDFAADGTIEFIPIIATLALPMVSVDLTCDLDEDLVCEGVNAVRVDADGSILDLGGTVEFVFTSVD